MKRLILFCAMIIIVLSVFSCKEKYEEETETFAALSQSGCISCHMDKDLLEEVADPIEYSGEGGGEG
jgi:hypothetical protein